MFNEAIQMRETSLKVYQQTYDNYGGTDKRNRIQVALEASQMKRLKALKLELEANKEEQMLLWKLRSELTKEFGKDLLKQRDSNHLYQNPQLDTTEGGYEETNALSNYNLNALSNKNKMLKVKDKNSSKQKHNAIALEKEEHVEILNYYNMLFSPNRPSKDKSWYENADYWLETYSLEEIKLAIKNWNAYPHWSKRDGKINGLTFLFRKFNTAREKVNYIDEMLKLDMKPKVEDKLTKQQLIDSKWEELYRNAI
jgi:hypothetical protein